jgi:hypothetical protein
MLPHTAAWLQHYVDLVTSVAAHKDRASGIGGNTHLWLGTSAASCLACGVLYATLANEKHLQATGLSPHL